MSERSVEDKLPHNGAGKHAEGKKDTKIKLFSHWRTEGVVEDTKDFDRTKLGGKGEGEKRKRDPACIDQEGRGKLPHFLSFEKLASGLADVAKAPWQVYGRIQGERGTRQRSSARGMATGSLTAV